MVSQNEASEKDGHFGNVLPSVLTKRDQAGIALRRGKWKAV